MSPISPEKMLSINISSFTKPSGYQLSELPKPVVEADTDVVIKVHAASINPIDVKKADGILKLILKESFPYKIGYDCAGVITEVGPGVARLKVGDKVYTRLPEAGSWSEYAKCLEKYVALKPENLSFEDASAVPLAAMTALQALGKYEGDLSGKTVFVPAGLSGTGSFACQLAKTVFGARVITTVSTSKLSLVEGLLGKGVVDEVIDYTKSDPKSAIPKGSVDFIFDTVGIAMEYLCLLRPKTGMVVSIASSPSSDTLQSCDIMDIPSPQLLPIHLQIPLNMMDGIRKLRAWRWNVSYMYILTDLNFNDLDALRGWLEKGDLKSVVGMRASFTDIDDVRKACQLVYSGKGGIGKAVIKMPES